MVKSRHLVLPAFLQNETKGPLSLAFDRCGKYAGFFLRKIKIFILYVILKVPLLKIISL